MYIDRITLAGLRGFDSLEFSLRRDDGSYPGWTVITGDNGSGKSTLLKAVAVALAGKDTARALQPSFRGWVRDGEHLGSVELDVVRVAQDDDLTAAGKAPQGAFPARIEFRNGQKEPQLEIGKPATKSSKSYVTPQRTIWSADARGWFSCGYGPFRRVFGASAEATRQMMAPATGRYATLFQEAASLAEVDEWLRSLSHKALEGRDPEKRQLGVILELLRDELLPNQITVDRVDSDGLWLRDRTGLCLAWSDMSDGYRSALALLTDILRHLFDAYGEANLVQRDDHGRLCVARSGVVLIDEIDAHLHPEWQREIGFWLKRHFPFIQFIVTTHSPIICQAADTNGLFVLPEPGSDDKPRALTTEEYRVVVAAKSDTILRSSAFGLQNTRSPRAVEARAEYSALNAKRRAGAKLSRAELSRVDQLELFVGTDEGA